MNQVVAMLNGSFTMHMTDMHGRANEAVLRTLHTTATAIAVALGGLVALRIGLTTAERKAVVDRVRRLLGLRSAAPSTEAI